MLILVVGIADSLSAVLVQFPAHPVAPQVDLPSRVYRSVAG